MTRPVDIDQLTDEEIQSYYAAVQLFRSVSDDQFFHSVPVRDASGAFSEVRFYRTPDSPKPVAVASIRPDGKSELVGARKVLAAYE